MVINRMDMRGKEGMKFLVNTYVGRGRDVRMTAIQKYLVDPRKRLNPVDVRCFSLMYFVASV